MASLVKHAVDCKVLVVDDEEVMCRLFQSALKDLCNVQTCLSGAQALELIRKNDFDVVVSDLLLGDIEGIEVLRAARQKDNFTELMVITGHASLESASKAIEIGVSSYLMKPVSIFDIKIQIEKALATRLFHLKSVVLMKHSDSIAPDIKGHIHDITSLFNFSRKLMLSLEIPEIMRVILDEINSRFDTIFCVMAIHCHDVVEIHAMPKTGIMDQAMLRASLFEHWDKACNVFDRILFDKDEIPVALYSGRQDAEFAFENTNPICIQLSVMSNTIGTLSIFGKKDFIPSPDELQFLYVFTSLVSSIVEHGCVDMRARLQARTDGLTGIANHRSFHESLSREIARADRTLGTFGLILIDIDDFKKINDTYGHLVGDAVIRNLVDRVSVMTRRADTFARYGGEEFGIILVDTGIDGTRVLAQRICKEIAGTPYMHPKNPIRYTISLGLSLYDGKKPRQKNALIAAADKALYKSKADGKSRISEN